MKQSGNRLTDVAGLFGQQGVNLFGKLGSRIVPLGFGYLQSSWPFLAMNG